MNIRKNFGYGIFAVVITLAFAALSLTGCPPEPEPNDSGTPGLEYNLINGDTAYSVSKGTVTGGKVVIPAIYQDLPVTEISQEAFRDCTGITSVTILASVTEISQEAFNGCTGLTSITIPDSVTSIGTQAFYGCTGLTSITIPSSVTSIGSSAFYNCDALKNVIIDTDKVTTTSNVNDNWGRIFSANGLSVTFKKNPGDYAFSGYTGLTSVTILASVTEISQEAFNGCTGLTSITIPDSVTSIGNNAFKNCSGLTSITVDANNPNYASQDGILYNKAKTTIVAVPTGISGDVTIPDSVTSIGGGAFSNCTGLTSVTIPASVTQIGNAAFIGWTSSQTINVPWSWGNKPSGWDSYWNFQCEAKIVYQE